MECEYGRNISLAIQQTDRACNNLRKIIELARKNNDSEGLTVFQETLIIHQNAVVEMTKQQTRHQAECDSCRVS